MFDHCLLQQGSVPAGGYNTKPSAKSAEAMQAMPGSLHHLLSQGQLVPFRFLREMTGGSHRNEYPFILLLPPVKMNHLTPAAALSVSVLGVKYLWEQD